MRVCVRVRVCMRVCACVCVYVFVSSHHVVSKLEQCVSRVPSRRENKDQWSTGIGVFEGLGQVEGRRLNKLATEFRRDKLLNCWNDLGMQHNSTTKPPTALKQLDLSHTVL